MAPRSRRGFGTASIVVGVLGLAVALVEPTLALVFGLLGLSFGLLARDGSSRRLAGVGVIINAAALVVVTAIVANLIP